MVVTPGGDPGDGSSHGDLVAVADEDLLRFLHVVLVMKLYPEGAGLELAVVDDADVLHVYSLGREHGYDDGEETSSKSLPT